MARKFDIRGALVRAFFIALVLLMTACGGGGNGRDSSASDEGASTGGSSDSTGDAGGSGDDSRERSDEEEIQPELESFEAESTFGRVTFTWQGPETSNLLYSSDPDCHWAAYATCPHSGLLNQQRSGLSLGVADGLDFNRTYFFVAEADGDHTDAIAATPWMPGVSLEAANPITTSLVHEDIWYVGGDFENVGPPTAHAAWFDLEQGALGNALFQADDVVRAVVADGDGGWYLGGYFNEINGQAATSLVHVRANGSLNPDWRPELDDAVHSLALHDGRLYAGGAFSEVDTMPRPGLAAFDVATGDLKDWSPTIAGGTVQRLAATEERLYLLGDFTQVSGADREGIAAVDVGGNLLDWHPVFENSSPYAPEPRDILVAEGSLTIGGKFDTVDGQTRHALARFDSQNGELLDALPSILSTAGKQITVVYALAADDQRLYVTGLFNQVGGETREGLAALEADTGDLTDWQAGSLTPTGQGVQAMEVHDGVLYIGGDLNPSSSAPYGGSATLVAVDTQTADWVIDFDQRPSGTVFALAAQKNQLFAGGDFMTAGGVPAGNLAAFDRHTGELLENMPSFDGSITDLLSLGDSVIAVGDFERVNGEDHSGVARFNTQSGELESLSAELAEGASIESAALADRILYLGGSRLRTPDMDRTERRNLIAVHADTGELMTWEPDVSRPVQRLAYDDGRLFVYARGLRAPDGTRANLQAYYADGAANGGERVDWAPGPGGAGVRDLTVIGDELLFSGRFDWLEDDGDIVLRDGLVSFDLATLSVTDWAPEMILNYAVSAIGSTEDRLYLGGNFDVFDGTDDLRNLVALSRSDRSVVEHWKPVIGASAQTLEVADGVVYVTGHFRDAGGDRPHSGMAAFDAVSGNSLF